MNIKMRVAVQASEFYKKSISVYDFVFALIKKDSFHIVTLINEDKVSTLRQLEWNPITEFLIAYEVNRRAMVPDYNLGLAPNYKE